MRENLPRTQRERFVDLDNFDNVRKKVLPDNYNLVDGWWLDRQKEIIRSLDPSRFGQLSIEITKYGPERNPITEFEALTILQAEDQKLIVGISSPEMINDKKAVNFDFKI